MVNIIVSSDPRYKVNKLAIRSTVMSVLQRNNISGRVEIGVNVIGSRKMHELNRKYRGIDGPTDILSFALEDSNPTFLQHIPRVGFISAPDAWLRLGDIVISYPQALDDAAMDGSSVDDEINALVEHGVNHLLGKHHEEN